MILIIMGFSKRSLKLATAVLAGFLFLSNCVFAHAAETNFWKQRQQSLQLASLLPAPAVAEISKLQIPTDVIPAKPYRGEHSGMTAVADLLSALPPSIGSVR